MTSSEPGSSQSRREVTELMQPVIEQLRRKFGETQREVKSERKRREELVKLAVQNLQTDETVRQWLRENSESESFSKLMDMFDFLKICIDEEEKKNHSDDVDITFWAHGSIRLPMIPASRLLPLSNIRDVVLYSPWNCVTTAKVKYGVATGKIQPQHRVFYCGGIDNCHLPEEDHQPVDLPDHWNSLRKAGGRMIPTIMVSPLHPEDGLLKAYDSLTETHGPPGRNRILIPFMLPGQSRVPFSVVTLALSLVLLSSRFRATVHLGACLSKSPADEKLDEDSLQQQYAHTIDDTVMTVSDDMLNTGWFSPETVLLLVGGTVTLSLLLLGVRYNR